MSGELALIQKLLEIAISLGPTVKMAFEAMLGELKRNYPELINPPRNHQRDKVDADIDAKIKTAFPTK